MTVFDFPRPPAWTERAVCASVGGDIWFPEIGGSGSQAIAICNTCPVRAECLELGLNEPDDHGIFGGVMPRRRRAMRRAAA